MRTPISFLQRVPVADGHVIIATGNDNQLVKLCGVLGKPGLAEQTDYKGARMYGSRIAGGWSRWSARFRGRPPPTSWLAKLEASACRPGRSTISIRFSDPGR